MKNYLIFSKKTIFASCFAMFSFLFVSNAYAQKAQITVINNGTSPVTFHKVEGRQRGSGTVLSANQRTSTQHKVGASIEVTCKGKVIQTFYVSSDDKKNKFTVVCN